MRRGIEMSFLLFFSEDFTPWRVREGRGRLSLQGKGLEVFL